MDVILALLGVSSNCTRAVVETLKNDDMTELIKPLAAVIIITNLPVKVFTNTIAIAEATDLPVVLIMYRRTGVNMTAETTFASGTISRILSLLARHRVHIDG